MAGVTPRRDQGVPPGPPRPEAVAFGTPEDRAVRERQRFIKYLVIAGRLGRDDRAADDG